MSLTVTPYTLAMSALLAVGASACGAPSQPETHSGPGLAITVAPLSLPGVRDARYWLRITNAAGDLVVERRDLDSSAYGDGAGSLSYVAPCDASGTGMNTVTLVLEDLFEQRPRTSPLDHETYVNPCGLPASGDSPAVNWDGTMCSQTVACLPNADRPVTFNLVIARDAQQGFFDIAVDFEDVFCSAKLDCVDALLHDADGVRSLTAVMGFACTSGTKQPTSLYLNDVRVECEDPAATYYFDPSQGPGQHGPVPADTPVFFQTATYLGREGFTDLAKCYWNQALGLDLQALGRGCHLHARGTAASVPFGAPLHTTPPHTIYPVITWSVPLTDGTGALVCGAHPLGSDEVQTTYTTMAGERFTHRLDCDDTPVAEPTGRTECAQANPAMTFTQTADGVVVRAGSNLVSAPFRLAPGLSVQGCCGDPCCN